MMMKKTLLMTLFSVSSLCFAQAGMDFRQANAPGGGSTELRIGAYEESRLTQTGSLISLRIKQWDTFSKLSAAQALVSTPEGVFGADFEDLKLSALNEAAAVVSKVEELVAYEGCYLRDLLTDESCDEALRQNFDRHPGLSASFQNQMRDSVGRSFFDSLVRQSKHVKARSMMGRGADDYLRFLDAVSRLSRAVVHY